MSTQSTERTTPSTSAPPSGGRLGIALWVIVTCQLMLGLDATVVTIALPRIQHAHGMDFSASSLSWVQNAYLLAFGGLLLLGGRAGDIVGRRKVFVAGVVLFVAASFAGGLATSAPMLLTARAVQGVAAAIAGPSIMALIATNFQGQARAKALAAYSAVTGAGGAVGLLVGGLLADQASWRWVFFINIPIGLAIAVLAPRVIQETERRSGRFDLGGALLSTAGMSTLVYGFIRAASAGWSDSWTVGSIVGAVLLLAVFVLVESRVEQPILPLAVFADRERTGAYAAMAILAATLFGYFFFLTTLLQTIDGYSPLQAGLAFLPTVVMQFGAARLAPKLIQRYGPRLPMLVGPWFVLAGMIWMSQISAGTSYFPGIFVPAALFGAGGGITMMPLNFTVLSRVPAAISGAASGVAQTMVWAGGALGSAIFVSIAGTADRTAARDHPHWSAHEVLVHGMAVAFTAAAGFVVLVLLLIAVVVRRPSEAADH